MFGVARPREQHAIRYLLDRLNLSNEGIVAGEFVPLLHLSRSFSRPQTWPCTVEYMPVTVCMYKPASLRFPSSFTLRLAFPLLAIRFVFAFDLFFYFFCAVRSSASCYLWASAVFCCAATAAPIHFLPCTTAAPDAAGAHPLLGRRQRSGGRRWEVLCTTLYLSSGGCLEAWPFAKNLSHLLLSYWRCFYCSFAKSFILLSLFLTRARSACMLSSITNAFED